MPRPENAAPPGEFALIAEAIAPHVRAPGALGLCDDAALFAPAPGGELVLTADTLIENVHVLPDDPPQTLGAKLAGVNLSDLAAKGAGPRAALLCLALPASRDAAWVNAFAGGLAAALQSAGADLYGGDTTRTMGPFVLSLTLIGEVGAGRMVRRAGARPGDAVWVTGRIGEAALGLASLQDRLPAITGAMRAHLIERYRAPVARTAFGLGFGELAHAAADISDGLWADLGHVCAASGTGAEIDLDDVPFAAAAGPDARLMLGGAGDDYEIVFAASPENADAIRALGAATATPVTRIGRIVAVSGVRILDEHGAVLTPPRAGYAHF